MLTWDMCDALGEDTRFRMDPVSPVSENVRTLAAAVRVHNASNKLQENLFEFDAVKYSIIRGRQSTKKMD